MDIHAIIFLRHAQGVKARHQCRSRWTTNGLDIETGKLHAFGRELIDPWSLDFRRAKTAEVLIALIIGEDNNEIWLFEIPGTYCHD